METQNAVAEPDEDGTMRVWSSTQTIDGVQSAVARVLGVPAHSVNVGASSSLVCLAAILANAKLLGAFAAHEFGNGKPSSYHAL